MSNLFDTFRNETPPDPIAQAERRIDRAPQRKRFYAEAGVLAGPDGFGLVLDGKSVRTPGRRLLAAPHRAIAEAMAAEWAAQVDTIAPETMPVTRLGNSVLDGVAERMGAVADDVVKYAGTDLICYRAGHPDGLVARQAEHWDPVVYWAADALGANFILAEGIVHAAQTECTLTAVRSALSSDPWALASVHLVTTITGSALLALALAHGARDADAVWTAAHVDEDWNIGQWGADDEAMVRRAAARRDFDAAALVLSAMRQSEPAG